MSAERRALSVEGWKEFDGSSPAPPSALSAQRSALVVAALGTVPYADALQLQRAAATARIDGRLPSDLLILLEHPPVVTLGRSSHAANLLMSREGLAARGVELVEVERGGDVTFHGPGQLVGYPIFDLKQHRQDLHWYLRQVEEALIRALATLGLPATRNPGNTGVWTAGKHASPSPTRSSLHEPPDAPAAPLSAQRSALSAPSPLPPPSSQLKKLASIGIHAREWVTWHGFALNVTTDLRYFDLIVPCGIQGVEMTSLARELGRDDLTVTDVAHTVADAFGEVFDRRVVYAAPESLDILGAG